ncbi:MAG: LPS export ABC transporter periplasmic protein LptC [Chitinophagaceae bacterium]|nr:LPS export ABC transporter periplasmic protein LptC [Chitinophagaceae bacterium]
MQKRVHYICLFLFGTLMLAVSVCQAQPRTDTTTPSGAGQLLEFLYAEKQNIKKIDSLNQFISYTGKVRIKQDKTLFYADSAVLNPVTNVFEAFGNIHINDADSVHTYAQYLKYLAKEKQAFLKKRVRLTDGKSTLTTDELEYDVTVKIGTYLKGGKVINEKTTLTSTEGYYYGDTRDIIFKKKVRLVNPDYTIDTDTLQYNTNTEITTFTSPTTIRNDKKLVIKTRSGYYDLKNKRAELYKRPVIDDSTYTMTADDMALDSISGLSEFRGNAVYRSKDSTKGFDMIANNIKTNNKKNSLLATQSPLLLLKQDRDSIYIAADTFYSAKLSDLLKIKNVPRVRDSIDFTFLVDSSKEDSTDKYFEAYYNVKIYSDSMQSVGDSLFYALKDSVFRLFKSPVVWAQANQVTGDTIYMYLKKSKPERLYVFENAMALSQVDSSIYFNQVKGNTINAYFDTSGQIQFLRSKGNSENVYYATDEGGNFIGVNKNSSDVVEIRFADGKAKRVLLINGVDGTMYPMRQVNHEDLKLRNFKWLDNLRPKSRYDILSSQ